MRRSIFTDALTWLKFEVRAMAAWALITMLTVKGSIRNGRRKRYGGASTRPAIQFFEKSHNRYVCGPINKKSS
tara:strand:+ start:281 stop:499 length:219 start_codon:yes stop_codon:yes gene_type:complete